jgi:hypothetical protein
MEKSDIIFKASFNEFSSSARDNVESSAYWLIRNSELLILIPLIFGLNFTDIEWNHSGSFKLLGIQYSLAKDDRYIDNYYSKLEKIKKLLNDWSLRNISLLGKITVIGSKIFLIQDTFKA